MRATLSGSFSQMTAIAAPNRTLVSRKGGNYGDRRQRHRPQHDAVGDGAQCVPPARPRSQIAPHHRQEGATVAPQGVGSEQQRIADE